MLTDQPDAEGPIGVTSSAIAGSSRPGAAARWSAAESRTAPTPSSLPFQVRSAGGFRISTYTAPSTAPRTAVRASHRSAPSSERAVRRAAWRCRRERCRSWILLGRPLASAVPRGMMPAPMRLDAYVSLLRRNPAFARLYGAQLTSFAGDWFATVALLGLALEFTGSAGLAARWCSCCRPADSRPPRRWPGMLADRLDRRRLLVAADLARIPVALAFLLAHDSGTLWIAFVGRPAAGRRRGGLRADLFGLDAQPRRARGPANGANVLIGSAWGTMLAVGAALGGMVAATLGRDAAFVVNALSFAVSAALIVGIRLPLQLERRQPARVAAACAPASPPRIACSAATGPLAAFLLSKTSFGSAPGSWLCWRSSAARCSLPATPGSASSSPPAGWARWSGPFVARSLSGTDDRGLIRGIAGSFLVSPPATRSSRSPPRSALPRCLVFAAALRRRRAVDAVHARPPALDAGRHPRSRLPASTTGS